MSRDHVITAKQLSRGYIQAVLDRAAEIDRDFSAAAGAHPNAVLGLCFFEPSTRTHMSFETAIKRLGGDAVDMGSVEESSIAKGESLADTVRVIAGYVDAIVLRHPREGAARLAAEHVGRLIRRDGWSWSKAVLAFDMFDEYYRGHLGDDSEAGPGMSRSESDAALKDRLDAASPLAFHPDDMASYLEQFAGRTFAPGHQRSAFVESLDAWLDLLVERLADVVSRRLGAGDVRLERVERIVDGSLLEFEAPALDRLLAVHAVECRRRDAPLELDGLREQFLAVLDRLALQFERRGNGLCVVHAYPVIRVDCR